MKAQNTTDRILIKGKIIDIKDKLAIIGASVVEQDNEKRTITGVATDLDGNFAMRVTSTKNKLSISYIGYKLKVVDIADRRTFNISLESNSSTLNEVSIVGSKTVSNGTGLNIDARNQTTAVATISAAALEEIQATSIDQALVGRLPGVDLTANSGDPGAGMSIRIRGTSTINGQTNPLIVVDGIPYETTIPSDFNFATADEQGYASLLSIAPSDIKDITVLKDAAATAVWGSRAANGVLIINTKRGVVGAPTITYTFKGSVSKQPSAIPLLTGNQYSELIPEEVQNVRGTPLNTLTAVEFQYDPNNSYYYHNYSNNTDWVKAITQTGTTNNHNISITGGGEKARYFASVGYDGEKGTTVGTGLDRINTRFNLDYIVSNNLRFRADVAYTHSLTKGNYYDPTNKKLNVRNVAMTKMPNMSIYEYDEYGNLTPNYFSPASNIQGQYPATYNPVAMANTGINNTTNDRVTPHFNLQYIILPDLLTSTADVQFDINNNKTATFLPQTATGRPITETVVNRGYGYDIDVFNVQSKVNFIATPKLGDKQSLQGLLSLQTNDLITVNQSQLTSNTASSILQDPSSASRTQSSELGVASGSIEMRSVAALLSAQYGLLDRYLINVGIRGDGNSRFGPSHRYGLFPSISTRWRLSGEPFMKRFSTFLDDLSFRASYGQSGNTPTADYSFYNTYGTFPWTYLGQSGVYSQNIQLDNLRWEKTSGTNLGFNLIMFKYRVNLDIEVYRNRTTDLLFNTNNPLAISTYNGYSGISMNAGTLDNQGFEIGLNTTPLKTKNWTIDFAFNLAHNENVMREISPYVSLTTGNTTLNGEFLSTLQVNNPLGSIYGYRYEGVYKDASETIATDKNGKQIIGPNGQPVQMRFNYPQTDYLFQPGDAKYQDVNHDGVIDYRDVVYLGNGNPKITGGFGPSVTYKGNWKLNLFFSYRQGFQLVNSTMMTTTNMYNYNNQSTAVLRRWEKPGDVTDIPRALYGTGYNWLGSSRYVQDGSFIKLSSVTVRYNFNQSFIKKLNVKNASIYLTGQNLLTFTHYLGQDPEVSPRASDIYRQAIDLSTTPPSKIYTVGLTASF
ncbi:MAG: SusC/RagA family TonB-linked outer membrane protein [Janthinobacterium lividum]